jgi:glycosyltransferase involved in cell wall biosynthesis
MSALDGLVILRYGHVYDSGGGMEQYLADLNRTLLERSAVSIVQVQLTSDKARVGETTEGGLHRVSLFVPKESHERAVGGVNPHAGTRRKLAAWGRDHVLSAAWANWLTRPLQMRLSVRRRDGEPCGVGSTVLSLHRRRPLDLICLHEAGGADVAEILDVARLEQIPTAYVHHYSNDRLSAISVRNQLACVSGVAGVSGSNVPSFLKSRFQNVSDGIDTSFFQRERAAPPVRNSSIPMIFLPARITPTKGQADLIRAAGLLKRQGFDFHVVFAGRTDTRQFQAELTYLVQREGVEGNVSFAGELDLEGLRDWYAAASIMAFPTRHHEGLPRILLECQSMEIPPVVYNSGGAASGLKDGETGFLVRLGDFDGLVARLKELLQDKARRTAMGLAGRRFVEEQFSLQALADRHERFYLQALASAGRSPGRSVNGACVR